MHAREVNYNLGIGGTWNVSVVSGDSETFPLGHDYKNNLILNYGLDVLAESKSYCNVSGTNFNTIPAFLYADAAIGNGTGIASGEDVGLHNLISFSSGVKTGACSVEDSYTSGYRIYKKVYDFPYPASPISVSEIGVRTPYGGTGFFSRFLTTGGNINLQPTQFLRLYYNFKVTCSGITGAIPISMSTASITGDGNLKLCGRFDDIFGGMNSDGKPIIVNGDSPRGSFMPYCEPFCVEVPGCTNECFGTSYMVKTGIAFPSANSVISTEWIGARLEEALLSVSGHPYVSGDFYRDITYKYEYTNPAASELFGGYLFTQTKTDRENTVDGWLWRFNNDQNKLNTKQQTIVLRQSVNRI